MEELKKVERVITGGSRARRTRRWHRARRDRRAEDALAQVKTFGEGHRASRASCSRRSTAPRAGGVAIAIAVELGLPVKLVGVGEGVDDLRPFDARDYARALDSA